MSFYFEIERVEFPDFVVHYAPEEFLQTREFGKEDTLPLLLSHGVTMIGDQVEPNSFQFSLTEISFDEFVDTLTKFGGIDTEYMDDVQQDPMKITVITNSKDKK